MQWIRGAKKRIYFDGYCLRAVEECPGLTIRRLSSIDEVMQARTYHDQEEHFARTARGERCPHCGR